MKEFQVCLSDKNYNLYFQKYPRKNARDKIISFIEFISKNTESNFNHENFLFKIYELQTEEKNIDFNANTIVKWDINEELYLYTLYNNLLNSVIGVITSFMDDKTVLKKLSNNTEYLLIQKALQIQLEAKEKEEIEEKGFRGH